MLIKNIYEYIHANIFNIRLVLFNKLHKQCAYLII